MGPQSGTGRFGEDENILALPYCTLQTCRLLEEPAVSAFNPSTPNDHYSGRTAPLTSKALHFIYLLNKYRH